MSSSYTPLKIEDMGTGEKAGLWGVITNTNLSALEEAITGSADITFASSDVTLILVNSNQSQQARHLRLNLIGVSGGARNLIVPGIAKQYIINNGLADPVTVKNSSGTGVTIPAGKTSIVFNTSSNVVDVVSFLSGLTLTTALNAPSGGTGFDTYTVGDLLYASTTTALSKLALGTQNYVVTAGASAPQYTNSLLGVGVVGRVVVITDATSITMNADTTDIATQANTQATGTLTVNAPTGTPVNGQKLILRIRSTNIQTFAWNAIFQGSVDLTLPTATSASGLYDYVGFMYNSTAAKWQLLARVMGF